MAAESNYQRALRLLEEESPAEVVSLLRDALITDPSGLQSSVLAAALSNLTAMVKDESDSDDDDQGAQSTASVAKSQEKPTESLWAAWKTVKVPPPPKLTQRYPRTRDFIYGDSKKPPVFAYKKEATDTYTADDCECILPKSRGNNAFAPESGAFSTKRFNATGGLLVIPSNLSATIPAYLWELSGNRAARFTALDLPGDKEEFDYPDGSLDDCEAISESLTLKQVTLTRSRPELAFMCLYGERGDVATMYIKVEKDGGVGQEDILAENIGITGEAAKRDTSISSGSDDAGPSNGTRKKRRTGQ
ncbi:hypothetical protein HK104_002894 [Borealophlyctis nickersoniae]|nr:hypothetical protein HK104_002894 [Borealophlyctis nickersoniae]